MPKEKEETPETPVGEAKLEYTDEVPPELQSAEEAAAAEKAAAQEAEPKAEEKLTITAEEEGEKLAETEAVAEEEKEAAPTEEPSAAEQIKALREVYDERFDKLSQGYEARLEAQQQQMERQYAPLLEATKKQELEQAQSEAVQNFHKALGSNFEETTGVSPKTAEAIATAAMQHLLPADPFLRGARSAFEQAVLNDEQTRFRNDVVRQVETALGTTEIPQAAYEKGNEVYAHLHQTNPKTTQKEAAQKMAEAMIVATRENGNLATAAVEAAPPPLPKAETTSAAPPKKPALSEEDEANLDFATRIFEDERRERGLEQIEPL